MPNFITGIKKIKYVGFGLLLLLLLVINLCFGYRADTDDAWFKTVHNVYPNVIQFLKWRYNAYSARIIPDGIDYFIFNIPIIIWQILNSFIIFIGAYLIADLYTKKVTITDMVIVLATLFLADFSLLWDGIYWVTGSLNYLWPIVASLFILRPFIKQYQNQSLTSIKWWHQLIMIVLTFYIGLSNEQILALLLGLILFFELNNLVTLKKINLISIPLVIILLGIMLFILKSPGITVRRTHEVSFWTPSFNDYSLSMKVRIWYIWALRNAAKLYNFIPLIITILMGVAYKGKRHYTSFLNIQVFLLPITMLSSIYVDFTRIFAYLYQPINIAIRNKQFWISLSPYALWTLEFLVLLSAIFLFSQAKWQTLIILISIIAGLMIVAGSPAIFSITKIYRGARIFFFIDFYIAFYLLHLLQSIHNDKIKFGICSFAIGNVLLGILIF